MTGANPTRPVLVTIRARSDPGRTRDHNEDFFAIADLGPDRDLARSGPHRLDQQGTVFLVADGMGGAAAGELASSMAGNSIVAHFTRAWTAEADPTPERFVALLEEAVEHANAELHAYAKEHPEVRGMGTTATVAGVLGDRLYMAQVGDSRGYLVRDGVATQLTKDQSLMQRLVDAGELTEEEAAQSERRNIILQALGPDPRIRVALTWQELQRGDTLVMCSDGLSGQVSREEIAAAVKEAPNLDRLCEELIALANQRGGPDNITVVVARFEGEGLPPHRPSGDVGYHALNGDSGESEIPVSPDPSGALPEAPAGPDQAVQPAPTHPAARPARRSGSPATIAVITVSVLGLLVLLYLLLRD